MLAFISLIGAVVVTIGWMIGISYVDYLVAQRRRLETLDHGRVHQQLAAERLFALPWYWPAWLAFGAVVLLISFLSALIGCGMLVLVNLLSISVIGAITLSDWQQLQRRQPPPPPPSTAWLYGVRGEHAGRRFQLGHQELTIGRRRGNTVLLRDRQVSRLHARICYAQGRFFLQDRSKKGTYLNGSPVDASVLRDGDQIAICGNVFQFRVGQ
jgi:hypothetical protein